MCVCRRTCECECVYVHVCVCVCVSFVFGSDASTYAFEM